VLPERCALKFVSCFFLDPFCTLTTVLLLSSPLLVLFVAFLASLHLLFFTASMQRQSRLKFPVLMTNRQAKKSIINHSCEQGKARWGGGGAFLFPRKRRSTTSSRCFHPLFLVPYVFFEGGKCHSRTCLLFCIHDSHKMQIRYFSFPQILCCSYVVICEP
jgi:hypothetical protein